MRDWTRGTISTRSLKRTRSTLLPVGVGASEEWVVGRWVGDELMLMLMLLLSLSPESHDFGSPKFGLSCKSIKRWASNIVWFCFFFFCGSVFVYRSLKMKMWIFFWSGVRSMSKSESGERERKKEVFDFWKSCGFFGHGSSTEIGWNVGLTKIPPPFSINLYKKIK